MDGEKATGLFQVKEYNRRMMRRALYMNGPMTRIALAQQLGLSLPTITTSVARMLEDGLLMEKPLSTPEKSNGRPAQLIDFNPDAHYAIGVELGPYQLCICVADLRGNIKHSWQGSEPPERYESMLDQIVEQITVMAKLVPPEKLLGVGVGLPGSGPDVIQVGAHPDWCGHTLATDLRKRTNLPVWLNNNVRMRAFGRAMFQRSAPLETFAYLYVARGVACPIIMNHRFLAGARVSIGKLGHTVIRPDGPICPTCGNRGCLGAVAAGLALCRNAQKLIQEGKANTLAAMLEPGQKIQIEHLLAARKAGDADVTAMLDEAVQLLGMAAGNVVNLIGPEVLSVDGKIFSIPEHREHFLEELQKRIYNFSKEEIPKIEFIEYNPLMGAQGAAAFVVRETVLAYLGKSDKASAE